VDSDLRCDHEPITRTGASGLPIRLPWVGDGAVTGADGRVGRRRQRIERVLGAGEMGSVYLAANPTLPRYGAVLGRLARGWRYRMT
jgi:hypothetical protein